MPPASDQPTAESSRAPSAGLRLMIIIVAGLALVAIYANVQRARRDKIEKVTIIPVASTPAVSPSQKD